MNSLASQDGPAAPDHKSAAPIRPRSRPQAVKALRAALQRLAKEGRRINIAAVALEAGYTAGLIHNTYPEIAEEIRAKAGRSARSLSDRQSEELLSLRASLRDAREQLAEAREKLSKLASINQTLREKLARDALINPVLHNPP